MRAQDCHCPCASVLNNGPNSDFGAGEAPFRNAGLRSRVHKCSAFPQWTSVKASSQPFPHIVLSLKTGAIRFTPLRHLQDAIIRKEFHDPIRSCALNASLISISLARIFICGSPDFNRRRLFRQTLRNFSQSRRSHRSQALVGSSPFRVVCHERRLSTTVRTCTRDEGGPFSSRPS